MEQKTTIIIVTFNAYDYVKKCLESVLKHTSKAHDIIIIDNKSDSKFYLDTRYTDILASRLSPTITS